MKSFNIYLNFGGNCEEAFDFYKSVFGGEFTSKSRYGDAPANVPKPITDDSKIMHISLPIGKENQLMGCDVPSSFGVPVAGNNFYIFINTESKEETDSLFKALTNEGKIVMPLEQAFWGSYFGMCKDQFGIQWMLSFETNS